MTRAEQGVGRDGRAGGVVSEAGQMNDSVTMGDGDGGARDGRGVDLFGEEPIHGGIVDRGTDARPCSDLLGAATTGGDPRWLRAPARSRSTQRGDGGAPRGARDPGGAHHRPAQREPDLPHRGQWLRSTCWRSCPHQQEGRVQMTRSHLVCRVCPSSRESRSSFSPPSSVGPVDGSTLLRNPLGSPRSNDRDRRGSISPWDAALSIGCPPAVGPFGTASGQRCHDARDP